MLRIVLIFVVALGCENFMNCYFRLHTAAVPIYMASSTTKTISSGALPGISIAESPIVSDDPTLQVHWCLGPACKSYFLPFRVSCLFQSPADQHDTAGCGSRRIQGRQRVLPNVPQLRGESDGGRITCWVELSKV